MNHAFDHCKTTENISKQQLLNALHECYAQLNAPFRTPDPHLDDKPAIASAVKCFKDAGHIGFTNQWPHNKF